MKEEFSFNFGGFSSRVFIRENLPSLDEVIPEKRRFLLVCDRNTEFLARKIASGSPLCVLPPGENAKEWAQVETILRCAREAGLGRDGVFIGLGGGVVTDLTAFAASVYMRGGSLRLVPTTLLAMADAALGGKTGFDLFGIKNLAGTFFPAETIYMCRQALDSLPETEWKSGMAEIIKTAIIDGEDFFSLVNSPSVKDNIMECVSRSAAVKGRIVEADPRETADSGNGGRALLNLGHTFGHALESALGLGRITHGEAVAWGTVRAAGLGKVLGITPPERAEAIGGVFKKYGYETAAPHPLLKDNTEFMKALEGDKKRKGGKPRFIVPAGQGAIQVYLEKGQEHLPEAIIRGSYS
ncbi:3-dehydroquinate synthase [Spirochaetia bacterium]|nr:3-dehydroquinate synthase [Spirochaetia bacterium]